MQALFRQLTRFRGDRSANVAMMFAIALIPLVSAVGCAVDYSLATKIRAKLQAAADAASVASVAQKAPGYIAAAAMTGDGLVSAGGTDATNVFDGNMNGIVGYSNLQRTGIVKKTGIKVTSNVSFSADVPVTFMKVLGYQTIAVAGSSASSASLPQFLDFYLMLDVSGSMGLPSTDKEQTRLAAINPDNYTLYPNGCTFACHFSSSSGCAVAQQKPNSNSDGHCQGYALSRTAGNSGNAPVTSCATDGTSACIQLRADAVGYAVQQLLLTANSTAKVPSQFRIGLYPFIQYLYAYFPLTSSINGSSTNSSTINYAAANLATLLDTGSNSNLGSGGTHFENALPSMNNLIASVGDGSASNNTQPFVFLVTDGAQNYQTQWGNGWSGSNSATVMDTSTCDKIRKRGVIISVLYIPYQKIQNPTTFANSEDFYANDNIPFIPPNLQACASPNYFFTANTPADITTALNAMFNQALRSAHITN